jgi:hypothetical protein
MFSNESQLENIVQEVNNGRGEHRRLQIEEQRHNRKKHSPKSESTEEAQS